MKDERFFPGLCGGLLAFAIAFGGVACMVTGLGLSAPIGWLAVGCAMEAGLFAFCLSGKKSRVILGTILGITAVFLIFNENFRIAAGAMTAHILTFYNHAYGVAIPDFLLELKAESHLVPLLVISGINALLCCRTVCLRKGSAVSVVAGILPLAACLVVTDTMPDIFWLFPLIFGLSLLVMTQLARRRDGLQGAKLTAVLALPLGAILALLLFLMPGSQHPEAGETAQAISDWFEGMILHIDKTTDGELVLNFGTNAKRKVNLDSLGNRRERETPVMEVTAGDSGRLYLRGRSFTNYDGKSWTPSQNVTETYGLEKEFYQYLNNTNAPFSVEVRTYGAQKRLYLPCYPDESWDLVDGQLENEDREKQYKFYACSLKSNWREYCGNYVPYTTGEVSEEYLALPEHTRRSARTILRRDLDIYTNEGGLLSPETVVESFQWVDAIEEYVKNSADYDTKPGKMPASAEDFAIWFLEENDKGYCVHFATAAVVLLRTAGIPARYVEGYTVQTVAGETTIVRDKMAHAWVEYYVNGVGWVILDPTPAAAITPAETTQPTAQTEQTEAPTEPVQTQPTAPSETGTTKPTAPSGTAAIGGVTGGDGTASHWEMPRWLLPLVEILGAILAVFLLTWGQWRLRREKIRRSQYGGSPNARGLARWRETERLCRILKKEPPEELRVLAEKAKYSPHVLTGEELSRFTAAQNDLIRQMRRQKWYRRVIYRLIYGAY